MSLFIVNFHWQTYSCNISFQAQRLERLRKERQNQIKCKNVQWKDRNTSCSGKRKYLLFAYWFYSCLWWLQDLQFVIFPQGFRAWRKFQFFVLSQGCQPWPGHSTVPTKKRRAKSGTAVVFVCLSPHRAKPWWLCGTGGQEVALPQGSPWQLSALQMHHHCLHGAPQPFPAAFGTLGAVEDFVEFTCVEYFCSYFFR